MADSDVEVGEETKPFRWASRLDPGTTLLVAGPSMTGKRELMYRILAAGRPRNAGRILVTTRKSGRAVAREYRAVHPGIAERIAVVDCVSGQTGFDTVDSNTLRYGSDPGDLTGIGIHVSEFMRQFHEASVDDVRLGLHTVSTMLMFADLRRVYQFLHVLVGRIDASGFVGVFVMDEAPGSERMNTLAQPFDGLVEVRMDDRRQYRVRGVGAGPDEWTDV